MVDVFSRKKRSELMSLVKHRGNLATEIKLIEILKKERIKGWRRHPKIFGNPDFIFPKARVAVFVDGCFWHNCPIHGSIPDTNKVFWERKLKRNRERDRVVCRALKDNGWFVLRIWQHELKKPKNVAYRLTRSLDRDWTGPVGTFRSERKKK
jgi:DNA mismatch endonuclease (patch repair protein)